MYTRHLGSWAVTTVEYDAFAGCQPSKHAAGVHRQRSLQDARHLRDSMGVMCASVSE